MTFGELLVYTVAYFGLFTSIFFILTLLENRKELQSRKARQLGAVTIIVPAYNEEASIAQTLKSLLRLKYPKGKLKIIVIDDGSTDSTYSIAKRFESSQCAVYRKKNGGKASALNFGLRRCATEFVGALDADSFVDPDALLNIMGFFEASPKVMAVTPSLKVYTPKTMLQKVQRIEYLIGVFLRKIFALLGSIHVTPGPFTIYRKTFFDMHGNYDEKNLTEDIEVALRIQKHGYYIENALHANVYTITPASFWPLYRQRMRWYIGFFENVWNYRELFSGKYGNLGLFILPASFFSVFLVMASLLYFTYKAIDSLVRLFINYSSINFDILTIMKFNFDAYFINANSLMLLSVLTMFVGILIVYFAKYVAMEKADIKGNYVLYIIVYWMLFGFWWIAALFYKATGRKIRWGAKEL
ncbi:glycosyltransferase family 2 protein [Candidatus Woesearchaeota archaeon]|nr:glycosyltransferase family 2 protein [Candidatus Woesearchaeota archaeon]